MRDREDPAIDDRNPLDGRTTRGSAPAGRTESRSPGAWSPFRHPTYRAVWIANVVSNTGTWMHEVGAGWLMTSLAPSPRMVAAVQAATSLPIFLLALPAGALADIIDRRRYLIVVQIWMASAAALLGGLTLAGLTTPWILLGATSAIGLGLGLAAPAWGATTPELVPRADLAAAVSLNSMGMNVSRAIGPALAGVIITAAGSGAVFLLNACSFAFVIAVLVWWRRRPRTSSLPVERFFGALKAGMRYTRNSPLLLGTMLRGAVFFIPGSASWALLPLIARERLHGGPQLYGWLVAAIGAGAVAGAIVLPAVRRRLSRDALVAAASLLYAVTLAVLGLSREPMAVGAAMVLNGAAWIAVLASLFTVAQLALPEWVRARGLAAFMAVFMGSMAGGSLLWGAVAAEIGLGWTMLVAAAAMPVALGLTARLPLSAVDSMDLSPSMHWPAPMHTDGISPDRGPVLVTIEYRIDPDDADRFLSLLRDMQRIRRRDGAFFWEAFVDAGDRSRVLEAFMVESWVEHLRQHERVTVEDRLIQERLYELHVGDNEPVIEHFVAGAAVTNAAPLRGR
ncbi:MFS transporter [soil metagenome]